MSTTIARFSSGSCAGPRRRGARSDLATTVTTGARCRGSACTWGRPRPSRRPCGSRRRPRAARAGGRARCGRAKNSVSFGERPGQPPSMNRRRARRAGARDRELVVHGVRDALALGAVAQRGVRRGSRRSSSSSGWSGGVPRLGRSPAAVGQRNPRTGAGLRRRRVSWTRYRTIAWRVTGQDATAAVQPSSPRTSPRPSGWTSTWTTRRGRSAPSQPPPRTATYGLIPVVTASRRVRIPRVRAPRRRPLPRTPHPPQAGHPPGTRPHADHQGAPGPSSSAPAGGTRRSAAATVGAGRTRTHVPPHPLRRRRWPSSPSRSSPAASGPVGRAAARAPWPGPLRAAPARRPPVDVRDRRPRPRPAGCDAARLAAHLVLRRLLGWSSALPSPTDRARPLRLLRVEVGRPPRTRARWGAQAKLASVPRS